MKKVLIALVFIKIMLTSSLVYSATPIARKNRPYF